MSQESIEKAAEFLAQARKARRAGERLPEGLRPADCDAALAIQRRVFEMIGGAAGGWKCGLPMGGKVNLAPIPAAAIYRASEWARCPVFTAGETMGIEPEVAFVLGRDLPARADEYSEAEVRSAIGESRLVLELLRGRYADQASVSYEEKLADSMTNQGLYVGPVVEDALWRKLDEFPITVNGEVHAGVHPSGHPLAPLVWLVNFLSANGVGLKAGQIITTGSYCGVLELPMGVPLRIGFEGLGELSVELVRS
jgi:2-keto-4-pentenoate hydratase